MLQRGDCLPLFTVRRADGRDVRYRDIWQRRNLVLVSLPGQGSAEGRDAYAEALAARQAELESYDAECIVTRDVVPGVPRPGVIVADRWGEIAFVSGGARVADLPAAADLVEWATFVQHQCPECQGEAK